MTRQGQYEDHLLHDTSVERYAELYVYPARCAGQRQDHICYHRWPQVMIQDGYVGRRALPRYDIPCTCSAAATASGDQRRIPASTPGTISTSIPKVAGQH